MSENIFFTKFSELSGNRFDPKYNDYITKYKVALQNSQKLATLLVNTPMYGANESATTYNEKCRYIRITDIDKYGLLKENSKKSAEVEDIKYKLKINDILFARSGATVGKTYIHKDKDLNAIFAGYMIKIEVDETKISPDYIFYYTQLNVYKQWVEAIQRSAGQPNINAEEYQDLDIPIPTQNIQNKIILKMEEAYQKKQEKEKEAQNKLDSIDNYLLNELGIKMPSNKQESLEDRVFFRNFSEISGNRYDSNAYHVKRINAIEQLKKSFHKLEKLKNITSFSKEIVTENKDSLPYIGLANITSNTGLYSETTDKEKFSSAIKFKKGQILFPKLRPYLNKVHLAEFDGLCSTEFHIFDSVKIENNYLSIFLLSQVVVNQTKYLMSGNTLPRLQTEDIRDLLIAIPPINIQNKIIKYAKTVRSEAEALKNKANEIFETSKKEVEKMILGDDL